MTDMQRLHEKVDRVLQQQIAQAERDKSTQETLRQLGQEVWGNGKTGLKQIVDRLKQRCDARTCASPMRELVFRVASIALGNGLILLIAWLLWVYHETPVKP